MPDDKIDSSPPSSPSSSPSQQQQTQSQSQSQSQSHQQQHHHHHHPHHPHQKMHPQKPRTMSNFIVRALFTLIMFLLFGLLIWIGPIALVCIVLIIQVKCFQEIIAIGYSVYRVHGLKWFRSLSWYFLLASNYFIFGESVVDYLLLYIGYHRFISFGLYLIGFVWFVLSLEKRYYMRQFSLVSDHHIASNSKTIYNTMNLKLISDPRPISTIWYNIF